MRIFGENPPDQADNFIEYCKTSEHAQRIYDFFESELSNPRCQYDKDISSIAWESHVHFLSLIADNLEEKDETILDAGCGSGLDITALSSIFPEKKFIGYDICKEQINSAKSKVKRYGLENILLYQGHHEYIQEPKKSVDILILKKYKLRLNEMASPLYGSMILSEEISSGWVGINSEFKRILTDEGIHIKYVEHKAGGIAGKLNPGFELLSGIVWPENEKNPSLNDPFDIAFLYTKN
jgi:SAM-dependent methyltransferase